jgi:chemotaxis family two-component system sensor kinase Cph1
VNRRVEDLLPPDEALRLVECVKEPVHIPGSIQPHGALLAFDPVTLEVAFASANTGELLGVAADELVGHRLGGPDGQGTAPAALRASLAPILTAEALSEPSNPTRAQIGGVFDVIVHRSGDLMVAEFEPSVGSDDQLLPRLHAAITRLSALTDPRDMQRVAAERIKALTGFERVMVYQFHPDGHGEIVADARVADLESYLGLHYPATDLPAQVRQLYLRQPSRTIVSADRSPVPLITAPQVNGGQPLDLSLAELRSVSPHHVEYMRNMGIVSSFSLALIQDGALIGMVSCNDRQRRHLPYTLRHACEILAQQISLQWGALVETQHLTRRLDLQRIRAQLVDQMTSNDDLQAGLLHESVSMLDLLTGDGAAVHRQLQLTTRGATPDKDALLALAGMIGTGTDPLVTDSLAADQPDIAALMPEFAGLVLIPFGTDGDYLAWFRRETLQTVEWLGDQNVDNRATPLSPRSSFAQWSQTVAGRCLPWEDIEVSEARQLRRDTDAVLLRRAEEQLAHLGLHDPLTGLPNRRLLMDRLDHALERHSRGAALSLLFIDIDRFKQINDTYGHDVGDMVILKATRLISDVVRAADTVARLGGDEFVVVCEDTDTGRAHRVVDRILRAFGEPMVIGGRTLRLTVSIGLTVADGHQRATDLLREADTAMYQAKAQGRSRASTFEKDRNR